MRIISTLLAVVIVLASFPAWADAKIGFEIPHGLELQDQNGEVQQFDTVSGEKGTVLVFFRSADWCPYCQVQLLDLRSDAQPIIDAGYSIVAISYDTPDVLKKFSSRYKFPYTLLSDTNSEAIKAFGILNDTYAVDHFAHGVPHPHVFVVGADKKIKSILAEEGHRARPDVSEIMAVIDAQ